MNASQHEGVPQLDCRPVRRRRSPCRSCCWPRPVAPPRLHWPTRRNSPRRADFRVPRCPSAASRPRPSRRRPTYQKLTTSPQAGVTGTPITREGHRADPQHDAAADLGHQHGHLERGPGAQHGRLHGLGLLADLRELAAQQQQLDVREHGHGDDRRQRQLQPSDDGAHGLRWQPRHLGGRRRRRRRQRFLRPAAHRDDLAQERAGRHADHRHLHVHGRQRLRRRGIGPLGQPLRRRDHGQLDPRHRERGHSRGGRRGHATTSRSATPSASST